MRGKTVCGRASQFLRRENVNSVNQKIVRPPLLSDVENKPVCPGREGKRNLASGNEKIPLDFRVVHLNMRRAIELNGTIACHAGRVADAGAVPDMVVEPTHFGAVFTEQKALRFPITRFREACSTANLPASNILRIFSPIQKYPRCC